MSHHEHHNQLMKREENQTNVGDQERLISAAVGAALLVVALRRRSFPALLLAPAGAALVYRGVAGQSRLYKSLEMDTSNGTGEIHVEKSVTVNKEPMEAYDFWRQLENLPRFMTHLEAVEERSDGRSHWRVKMQPGIHLQWEAEMTEDRPGELIAWRTLPGSSVEHHGQVRFVQAPPEFGTEVTVTMNYKPPAGVAGQLYSRLTNVITAQQIKEDIRKFKHILEAGELPTIEGQPSGRKN